MARCRSTKRAEAIAQLYQELAPELKPVLIHSGRRQVNDLVRQLQDGRSKVAITVNMLAEGFDLPQLKIAAVHDKHKSLTPLLQFVGRFSRTSGAKLGDATFITNTADTQKSEVLDRIYNDDPGWTDLLAEVHFAVAEQESKLREFVRNTTSLHEEEDDQSQEAVALTTIFPKHSAVIYEASAFTPEKIRDALPPGTAVPHAWLNQTQKTLILVTRTRERVEWSSSRLLTEQPWTLFVAHYRPEDRLLFLHSSDTGELHREIALALTNKTAKPFQNDEIFKVFGRINRLLLIQVGLKKRGGLKHRYSMFTGTDIGDALSRLETRNAVRSNFFGHGYQDGKPVNVGASAKGKLWSHNSGRLDAFIRWCAQIAAKLRDARISADAVFQQAIRPQYSYVIPDKTILHVVWPEELFGIQESSVSVVLSDGTTCPFSECDIALGKVSTDRKSCNLDILADDKRVVVRMQLGEQFLEGARFETQGAGPVLVRIGKKEFPLGEYLSSYPPLLLFSDGSELSGCLLYPVPDFTSVFPADQLVVKDWSNVDIQKESIRSGSESRKDSVQWRAYEICRAEAFDVIFNDDGSNEAADLVCVRDDDKHILVRLVHCKFSAEKEPGARLEDAVIVASQATRCVRWNWNFEKLCDHLRNRETLALQKGRSSRLLVGSLKTLKQLRALSRYRDVVFEIVAAQPGISKDNLTEQQKMVLGSAEHFIRETVAVGLTIWCSN